MFCKTNLRTRWTDRSWCVY